jgi:hypothetical protein
VSGRWHGAGPVGSGLNGRTHLTGNPTSDPVLPGSWPAGNHPIRPGYDADAIRILPV